MNASLINNKLEIRNDNRRTGPFSFNSLFSKFPERTAKKGDIILKRNHSLGYIFYLTEGMVKTISYFPDKHKEIVDGYSVSGDLMNLAAWDKNYKATTTLKVCSPKAKYTVIPVNDFRDLVLNNHGLNQLILSTLFNKMQKNNDRLHRLLLYKSRQRVIQFLRDYTNEVGQRVGFEFVIKKPFTHEEMGYLSDTSRQTVTTVLNELKAKNIIHFTRRYILIRDLNLLLKESKREL